MSWIDVVIGLIFLFFIITAFQAGFIREVIGITSTIAGLILAGLFYDNIADTILSAIDNDATANVIGFLIIFGGITIAGQLLAMLIHPAVVIMQLGIADQMLGGAFGAAKALIIVWGLLILMVTYPRYDMDERIDDSEFAKALLEVSDPILQVLPSEFESSVKAFNAGEDPLSNPTEDATP